MPSSGHIEAEWRAFYQEQGRRLRKAEAKARARGIVEGSSGWHRFVNYHRNKP